MGSWSSVPRYAMITGSLSLFCLGFCLGFEDEHKSEKLPKPSLNALPGPVVKCSGNVTLKCHCPVQNVTIMLGKTHNPGYRWEQNSTGYDAKFLLVDLEPKNAGMYFCACKTMGSHRWSKKSEDLQLVVTDDRDGSGASSVKTDTRIIFVTTFSCLTMFLLFPLIFVIYRCSQRGSSHEDATKRTSHSKFPNQNTSDLSRLETESLSTEDPQEDTCADVNNKAPSEEELPGSCD